MIENYFCVGRLMLRSMNWKSPILWLLVGFLLSAAFATLGPEEATLGTNVRVVYLHGAWVWTSLAAFIAAAALGLIALILRRENLHDLVARPRAHRVVLLDHLSPTLVVGHANQLEWSYS